MSITRPGQAMLRGFASLFCVLILVSAVSEHERSSSPSGSKGSLSLPFFYDLYTFRGETGVTTVVAAFAVKIGELKRENEDRQIRYRFDVTLVLADTALGSVSRTDDSVFVAMARPLAGEHLLHTYVELQAPPSNSTVQRVILTDATTPGIGQLYDSPFPIPDYSGDELMLSDIALGQPDARTGWDRRGVTLGLLPTSQFPEGSFDVYYEVYNLPFGNPYTTRISVESVRESGERVGADDAVSTRFSGESAAGADGLLQELRRVEATLAEGRYRLTVTVTDEETGRSATRSRPFEVRGWGQGVTLVQALPRRG